MSGGPQPADATSKHCPDCSAELPAAAFRRNARSPDGLSAYCKLCFRRRDAVSYRKRQAARGKAVVDRIDVPGHKRCASCHAVKPFEDFHRARSQAGGFNCSCKDCRRTMGKDLHLRRTYGLTVEQLEDMLAEQDGQCAICRQRPARHVDHDHVMGNVRGVLCFRCNAALGQFGDSTETLAAAIDYLERTTWQRHQEGTGVFRLTSPRRAARPSRSSSELPRLISSRRG